MEVIVANGFNYGMPMRLFILPFTIGDGSLILGLSVIPRFY